MKELPKLDESCIRPEGHVVDIANAQKHLDVLGPGIEDISTCFALVGNHVRFQMLLLLHQEGVLCACDFSDILEMKPPAISQHLRKLKDKGLVTGTKNGSWIYYELNPFYGAMLAPHFDRVMQEAEAAHASK